MNQSRAVASVPSSLPEARAWPGRFAFLRWPLTPFEPGLDALRRGTAFNPRALGCRYPIRAARYWWATCAMRDEAQRLDSVPTVADIGCGRGLMRRFVGEQLPARWIGADRSVDAARLSEAGYDEIHACDFDEPLPLDDGVADIVICLHIFEHLPRPEWTLRELARVLRPGGVLLAGSPVLPRWLAAPREKRFRAELVRGERKRGKHINCFWPQRWRELARRTGFQVEFLAGSHFLRWAGNPLENCGWWLRLNQLWGALIPSLGSEVYLQARAHSSPPASVSENSAALAPQRVFG